jgi:hypothetical protein
MSAPGVGRAVYESKEVDFTGEVFSETHRRPTPEGISAGGQETMPLRLVAGAVVHGGLPLRAGVAGRSEAHWEAEHREGEIDMIVLLIWLAVVVVLASITLERWTR